MMAAMIGVRKTAGAVRWVDEAALAAGTFRLGKCPLIHGKEKTAVHVIAIVKSGRKLVHDDIVV